MASDLIEPAKSLKIWFAGVGYEVAQKWYRKGYRSLEAVVKGETLTAAQKLGIELYHDFLQKYWLVFMPLYAKYYVADPPLVSPPAGCRGVKWKKLFRL